MGYTHYWNFKNNVAPKDIEGGAKKFKRAAEIIKDCLAEVRKQGVKIASGNGEGEPIINAKEIYFNGKGEESYETFYISLNEEGSSNFCKTACMPYDILVCLSLLAFKEVFGEDFEYRSDGITKEAYENRASNEYWKKIGFEPEGPAKGWQAAYDLWEKIMG